MGVFNAVKKIVFKPGVIAFIAGFVLGAGSAGIAYVRVKGNLTDEIARLNNQLESGQREIIETVNGIKEGNRDISGGLAELDAGLGEAADGSRAIAEHLTDAGDISTDIIGTTVRVREDYQEAIGIIKRLIEEEQGEKLDNGDRVPGCDSGDVSGNVNGK